MTLGQTQPRRRVGTFGLKGVVWGTAKKALVQSGCKLSRVSGRHEADIYTAPNGALISTSERGEDNQRVHKQNLRRFLGEVDAAIDLSMFLARVELLGGATWYKMPPPVAEKVQLLKSERPAHQEQEEEHQMEPTVEGPTGEVYGLNESILLVVPNRKHPVFNRVRVAMTKMMKDGKEPWIDQLFKTGQATKVESRGGQVRYRLSTEAAMRIGTWIESKYGDMLKSYENPTTEPQELPTPVNEPKAEAVTPARPKVAVPMTLAQAVLTLCQAYKVEPVFDGLTLVLPDTIIRIAQEA